MLCVIAGMVDPTGFLTRQSMSPPADCQSTLEIPQPNARRSALRQLLADVFVLYVKTKNFHWHMSGSHFRDYHLLLDEHGEQIFGMTDDIAERARKIGGTTLEAGAII